MRNGSFTAKYLPLAIGLRPTRDVSRNIGRRPAIQFHGEHMNRTKTILWSAFFGMALGAGTMYVLDPVRGRRRRSVALEKGGAVIRQAGRKASKIVRDLENRTRGLAALMKLTDGTVDDDVLVGRVRSRLGRLTGHPHRVDVAARNGVVTLSGTVAREEYDRLISDIRGIAGVRRLENRLAEATPLGSRQ